MQNIFLLLIVFFITGASHLPVEGIKTVPPLTVIQARGISLTTPDEGGWFWYDPDGKGAWLAKLGASKSETYAITLTYLDFTDFKSEEELLKAVKRVNTADPGRFKTLIANEVLNSRRGPYFVDYCGLAEDHEAHQKPQDQKFALLEIMGFYARSRHDPSKLIKVEYSYRYYPGHADPDFKKKAAWLLEHVTFAPHKDAQPSAAAGGSAAAEP